MGGNTSGSGRKPRVTDDELLDVFRSTDDPVLSTAEIAEPVPIQRRSVLNRLRKLEDLGLLDSKTIGGRNTVWWLTGEVSVKARDWTEHGKIQHKKIEFDPMRADIDEVVSEVYDMFGQYGPQDSSGDLPNFQLEESNTSDTADTKSTSVKDQTLQEKGIDPPRDEHVKDAALYAYYLVWKDKNITTSKLKNQLWKEYGGNYSSIDSMWTSINRHLKKSPHIESSYGKRIFLGDDIDTDQPPFDEFH